MSIEIAHHYEFMFYIVIKIENAHEITPGWLKYCKD
jgi:hypothetical protein